MSIGPAIYIVDDNKNWCDSLKYLFESVGIDATTYSDAAEFLNNYKEDDYGCLILDVRMPGMSGLELQRELISRTRKLHIIFVTGHANVSTAVRAMRDGAIDFFEKTVDEQILLDRVQKVIRDLDEQFKKEQNASCLKQGLSNLTPREISVLKLLLIGSSTRDIAEQLNISTRTIETYRAKILTKTQYTSMIELLLNIKEMGIDVK